MLISLCIHYLIEFRNLNKLVNTLANIFMNVTNFLKQFFSETKELLILLIYALSNKFVEFAFFNFRIYEKLELLFHIKNIFFFWFSNIHITD